MKVATGDSVSFNRKSLKQSIEQITTNEQGETIKKTQTNVYTKDQEPPFIKMYIQDILYLKDMPRGLNPVLNILLKNIQWGTNKLILNSALKRLMSEEINLSVATIEKAITKFVKAEILFRQDKGIYIFNPYLFGCGYWENIKEIRLELCYSLNGRTFGTNVIKNEDREARENK